LYRDEGGAAQGVVYLFDWDRDQRIAFWGFYARPEAPPGTGLFMEEDLLRHAFEEIGLHKLCCEVLATNSQVVNSVEKVGFCREEDFNEQFWAGDEFVGIIRFGILKQEWPSARDYLAKRLKRFRAIGRSIDEAPPPNPSLSSPREIVSETRTTKVPA
jgi:RimJ/RimL family protein N-acetyltransferase